MAKIITINKVIEAKRELLAFYRCATKNGFYYIRKNIGFDKLKQNKLYLKTDNGEAYHKGIYYCNDFCRIL